jgi:hypothetical protein
MRRGILCAIVVVLGLLAQAAPANAAELKLGMVFKYLTTYPDVPGPVANAAPSLDVLSLESRWRDVQPGCRAIRNGVYHWDKQDEAMDVARGLGVPVSLTIVWGAKCTQQKPGFEPKAKYVDDWLKFVRKVVQRYGSDPVFQVEIWSEPNLHSWGARPSAFAKFFLASQRTVQRVDPAIKVLIGGLGFCCGPERWLKSFYKSSRKIRRLGVHLGAHTYSPSPEVAIRRIRKVREVIPNKVDITITEHGWSTCPMPTETKQRKCVTPQEQADQMGGYIDLLRARQANLKIRGFYWFQSQDFSEPSRVTTCPDLPKHFYGIWKLDGSPKLSLPVWEDRTDTDLPDNVDPNPLVRGCDAAND